MQQINKILDTLQIGAFAFAVAAAPFAIGAGVLAYLYLGKEKENADKGTAPDGWAAQLEAWGVKTQDEEGNPRDIAAVMVDLDRAIENKYLEHAQGSLSMHYEAGELCDDETFTMMHSGLATADLSPLYPQGRSRESDLAVLSGTLPIVDRVLFEQNMGAYLAPALEAQSVDLEPLPDSESWRLSMFGVYAPNDASCKAQEHEGVARLSRLYFDTPQDAVKQFNEGLPSLVWEGFEREVETLLDAEGRAQWFLSFRPPADAPPAPDGSPSERKGPTDRMRDLAAALAVDKGIDAPDLKDGAAVREFLNEHSGKLLQPWDAPKNSGPSI